MSMHATIATFVLGTAITAGAVRADVIVQTGQIPQGGQVEVILDQFDDEGGVRELNFVQIELLSRMRGGFTTSGTGGRVHVTATFDQEYFLDGRLLAGTHVLFRDSIENDLQRVLEFLVTDSDEAVIRSPNQLEPWIGTGQITLTSIGEVVWDINPPEGLIQFGAGLFAEYTVTYDFTVRNCNADVNNDGVVDVLDLLAVIGAWGNTGGPEDINGDGIVDVLDLLEVVAARGPCP